MKPVGICLFLLSLITSFPVYAQPALDWPLSCGPEDGCRPTKYVDHDQTPDMRDYSCGRLASNGHKGTDFAVTGDEAMRRGVKVLAPATGRVAAVRDGLPDTGKFPKGQDCGNGLRLDHKDGWTTQYCHMRQGSLTVKLGQIVQAGDMLGLVGRSGLTEYAHLHFQVSHGKTIIDPFIGAPLGTTCGVGAKPLWRADALAAMSYAPIVIYNLGFAGELPTAKGARAGKFSHERLSPNAPVLILWAEVFGMKAGDMMGLQIIGPDGAEFFQKQSRLEKTALQYFKWSGRKLKSQQWPAGIYKGIVTISRGERSVQREVEVKIP